ncbi:hypothetical protein [Pyrococcus kukulkanii]
MILTLALILSGGYILLREGIRPIIPALLILPLIVGIVIIVKYAQN